MSQAGIISTTSGPVPPVVPTSFETQDGTAVPSLNILIVDAFDSVENNDNGVTTKGGVAAGDPPGTGLSNELDIYLTNRQTGTVSTVDNTLTTIQTFNLGSTAATFYLYGSVQAFNASTPAGASYGFSAAFRTTGAAATEIATEYHDEFEEAVFITADIFLTASGNTALLQVQGPLALSVNWNSLIEFRQVI